MAGLLIAVEGMEGSGKTTAIQGCADLLREHGIKVAVAPEFSDSGLGIYLAHRLEADRFLRDPNNPQSAWTQVLAVCADTAYRLEYDVPVLRRAYEIVLLDRYRESVVACQHVALADEYGISDDEARRQIVEVAARLPDVADLVLWLEVAEGERFARMQNRGDLFEGDEVVLRRRESAYRWLRNEPKWNWRGQTIDGTGTLHEVAARLSDAAMELLNGTQGRTEA